MPLGDEFRGLPMESLIGAPLEAACTANLRMAQATAEFISAVGFKFDDSGKPKDEVRNVDFRFSVPGGSAEGKAVDYCITTPLLAIVPIPSLKVTAVDITFDMEVKTSESSTERQDSQASAEGSASVGWGPFKVNVKVSGSVATHRENTRSTDKSAKYHVEVKAEDHGMTEGLARVLDIMNKCVVPVALNGEDQKAKKTVEKTTVK